MIQIKLINKWLPLILILFVLKSHANDLEDFKMPDIAPWPEQVNQETNKQFIELLDKDDSIWFNGISDEALPQIKSAAEKGSSLAAYFLGQYYEDAQNMPLSIQWYREAVRSGSVQAALELSAMYFPMNERRIKIPPNLTLAYVWGLIAQRGLLDLPTERDPLMIDPDATQLEHLGAFHSILLPTEKIQAKEILTKWPEELPPEGNLQLLKSKHESGTLSQSELENLHARSEAGDKIATEQLIRLYQSGKARNDNDEHMMAFLKKASDEGFYSATMMIAWAMIEGYPLEKDEKKGKQLLEAQIAKGHIDAYCYLGYAIEDKNEAAKWYQQGAEKGSPLCMNMLGNAYRQRGDKQQAKYWLEEAAKKGVEEALMTLVTLGESERNWFELTKWMVLITLRHPDPLVGYRTRLMLAMISAEDEAKADYEKGIQEAEAWHQQYPLPVQ